MTFEVLPECFEKIFIDKNQVPSVFLNYGGTAKQILL